MRALLVVAYICRLGAWEAILPLIHTVAVLSYGMSLEKGHSKPFRCSSYHLATMKKMRILVLSRVLSVELPSTELHTTTTMTSMTMYTYTAILWYSSTEVCWVWSQTTTQQIAAQGRRLCESWTQRTLHQPACSCSSRCGTDTLPGNTSTRSPQVQAMISQHLVPR